MKKKLKIQTHQIDQFKDEISSKEAALVKVNLEHTRIEKEKEALRAELQRLRKSLEDSGTTQSGMEKQIANLQQVIRDADAEKKKQQNELDQIVTERDILGTQLVRRNDELTLLHEKTKLQQSTLMKGEEHYKGRLDDTRVMKLELIQQVHALQKRLIQKTEEIANKEFVIRERETVYVELREILARQPGPEVAEQLHEFQRSLKCKTKQLKRLSAELNMSEVFDSNVT